MIDFTHVKKPDFVHLVLIIAVVCLALGAITPAASAIEYENLTYSSGGFPEGYGTINLGDNQVHEIPNALPDGSSVYCQLVRDTATITYSGHSASLTEFIENSGNYTAFPYGSRRAMYFYTYWVDAGTDLSVSQQDVYVRLIADFIKTYTDIPSYPYYYAEYTNDTDVMLWARLDSGYEFYSFNYSSEPYSPYESLDLSLQAFTPTDPFSIYVLNLDGILLDTTYTVGVNRYTGEFKYLIDSYAYTDPESGSYTFTGSQNVLLPIYYNGFTNMPYSYEVSINVNDENGYLDKRYPVYWSDRGGLYETMPEPGVPTPTPTPTVTFVPSVPVNPSDIILDPESLNNTVNITGWYQDQGFEGNNITAPIYSGIRGWFNENLVPVIDFFLTPTNYVATVISDSAETSTDGISYITDELGSYAAPFNTVGAYVVRLVPEVVWLVVFAALSIGYVILLIKISTGSIRDTIGRFLGGSK